MIQISNDDYRIEIADQQLRPFSANNLAKAVSMILQDHQIQTAEISIAVVDDSAIRELNRQYLDHDYETDVLSFLLDETADSITGQLIVSTDTAARVAEELGIEMEQELLLYVVHGTLHLMGLDDTDPETAVEMRSAEQEYLARLGVKHRWPDADE